jgi:hypothetical protein
MRRIRRIADQAKADKMEKSYALKHYSSKMASSIGPPFVKKKLKRRKRRNERRFQKKKRRHEKKPSWESELDVHPSQPVMFETFIKRFLNFDTIKCINNSVQSMNLHFHQEKGRKIRGFIMKLKQGRTQDKEN